MLYGTLTNPSALYPGDSFNSINNEASTVYPSGTAGERVAIAPSQDGSEETISMELSFSANPGAFEIDLQAADTDTNGAYQCTQQAAQITQAAQANGAGNWYARCEIPVRAKFARAVVVAQPANACNIRATIGR